MEILILRVMFTIAHESARSLRGQWANQPRAEFMRMPPELSRVWEQVMWRKDNGGW